ncbi:unnamed protein product, partial [Sphenostylis stenocarpa]
EYKKARHIVVWDLSPSWVENWPCEAMYRLDDVSFNLSENINRFPNDLEQNTKQRARLPLVKCSITVSSDLIFELSRR